MFFQVRMWTVIAFVILTHFSCNIVAITSDGYFGCILSSKLHVFEAHPDTDAAIVDRACLELCRESNKLYSVLHGKTCHCSTSVPEVSGQPFLGCADFLVYSVADSTPLEGCHELAMRYGSFWKREFSFPSKLPNSISSTKAECRPKVGSSFGGSIFFPADIPYTAIKVSDGSPVDLSFMNPYDERSPGLDITGSGIEIEMEVGKVEPYVIGAKVPINGFSDTSVTIRFQHYASNESKWWNPDQTEDNPTFVDGTTLPLKKSSQIDAFGFHHLLYPTNPSVKARFAFNKIQIRGSDTNFKFDLIGHFYNRETETAEPKVHGCEIHHLDDYTHILEDMQNEGAAEGSCFSKCGAWYYSGMRRVGPRSYQCKCHSFTNVVGKVDDKYCGAALDCDELSVHQTNFFNNEANLMSFLESSRELKIAGQSNPSTEPNICNSMRKVDVAGSYTAHIFMQGTNQFYNNELDLNQTFVFPVSYQYNKAYFEVTDPEVVPNYRRILNLVSPSTFRNTIKKYDGEAIKSFAYGIYSHCLNKSQITCGSAKNQFCHDVSILAQKTMHATTDTKITWDETLPLGCTNMETFLKNGFYPYKTLKKFERNCNSVATTHTLVSFRIPGVSTKNQILVNASAYNAPIPGTSNVYVCDDPWKKLDGSNEPFQIICSPHSKTNVASLEQCYPPTCDKMLPAEAVSLPAPGTRFWNTSSVANGTILNEPINYTCPVNHAFNGTWKNDLIGKCEWSTLYLAAVWQYWLAPGENMTEDPARQLPACVPYCFEEFDATNSPGNTTMSKTLPQNTEGQEVKFTCKYGHEFADDTAKNVLKTDESDDDFLAKERRKHCREEVHPEGGLFVDKDPIPETCYIINCTKNVPPLPPATGAEWNMTEVEVDNDGLVPLKLNSVLEYKCTTRGKKFQASGSKTFVDVIKTTCKIDKKWDLENMTHTCEWAYCLNPPIPPANHNLSLSIDPSQLIEIGADIRYDCVAGGHNRIRRNHGNNSFSLQCKEDNVIEEPTEWPTCVPDAICPEPSSNAEIEHNLTSGTTYNFLTKVSWTCVDPQKYIKKKTDPSSSLTREIGAQCEWDSENWTLNVDMLECQVAACVDFPVPPASTNMVQSSHIGEPDVVFGVKVQYSCKSGQFFSDQVTNSNHSLSIECLELTSQFQTLNTWPQCKADAACVAPETNEEINVIEPIQDPNSYEAVYNYKCKDQRFSISEDSSTFEDSIETKCQWNNQWSKSLASLSCILSHCWEYPVPPVSSNMNRSTHWNDMRVTLGTKITYECGPNMYFEGQDRPENRTIELECLSSSGQFTTPDPWPVCSLAPSCPNGPPDAPNGISTNYSASDPIVYGSNYSYSCDDPRMRVIDPLGANVSLTEIPTSCLWNKKWSHNPVGLVCDLVACHPPPDQTNLNMISTYVAGSVVLLETVITYQCIQNPKPTYFDSDRDQTRIDLKCLDTGFYNDSIVWPTCVENVHCGTAMDPPENGSIIYLDNADIGEDTFGITVEYRCAIGKTFATNETVLTSMCQWNKTWTLSTLPECGISHCVNPPNLPPTTYLEDRLPNEMTRINQNRTYHCRFDSSFESDFQRKSYDLFCKPDGSFELANWPRCVTTVNCNASEIPAIPDDGVLNINGSPYDPNIGSIPNIFQTVLEFFCGPSRKFRNTNGSLYDSSTMTCHWNKSWTPRITLDPCIWFQCLLPPTPPEETNLKLMDSSVVPTEFNQKVFYECKPGHWFEHDRSQSNFSLTCQTSGYFKVPLNTNEWPRCVQTVFCPDPPGAIPPLGAVKVVPENVGYRYGTKVIYSCGTARLFYGQGTKPQDDTPEYQAYIAKADFGKNKTYESQEINCHWDKRWVPEPIFDPCIWTACMNPPSAPEYTYLKSVWDGKPIPFGQKARYQCKDIESWEYGELVKVNHRYFVSNRSITTIDVECLPGGNFKTPSVWPTCTDTINCYSFPIRGPGMTWENPGDHKFESTIKYGCGPLRQFSRLLPNGTRELFDEAKAKCEWNGKFQPENLPPCQATYCLGIPQPPPETLLTLLPSNPSTVRQIIERTENHWKRSQPREEPKLTIPKDFCKDDFHEYFYLYGSIPTDWNANFTIISFESTNDAALFVLQIFPREKYINRWLNRFKDDPTFKRGFVSGQDEGIVSTIDLDEPFELKVTCDSQGFSFIVEGDPSYPSLDHEYLIHTFDLDKVVVEGTTSGIEYMAFVQEGVDPKVPVGLKAEFGCPDEYVLNGDHYREPLVQVTCAENGTFGSPNWQTCVSVEEIMQKFREGLNEDNKNVLGIPTSDDENVIVTLPTNNPALGPVEFPHTTRYHWPNFDLNATDPNPEDFEVVSGPNLFREAVELKQGHDKCLIDKEFAAEDDTCIRNPVNCEDGFSFSLFFKPNYDLEPHQFFNASKTFFQEYIVSTGGDKGSPGFGIYIQGGDIGAVVSTGVQVWKVQVKGGAPDNKTWTNLAIKWEPPLFNTEDELEELLTVKKKKFHELGGLQLYRNLELIGQTFHPDEDVEESGGEQFDQPEIMIGCHRTPQDSTPRKFSHGSYDELAFWARALNATEEVFFLGGYKDVFEDVGTDDLLKILNFIDYADVNQADTAINIMDSIVNGEEEEEAEFRNIYPETTPTPSESLEDENGTTSTVSSSTTTTTTEAPKKDPTKDVKNLMKIAKKLTSTDSLNYYITKREFDVRMKAVGPLGEFMGVKGKYAEGWTALKKDKNEAGPFETLTNLKNYVKYNVERYTVVPPDSRLRETRRVVSTNNFVMEAFKMTSTNFGKLGSVHNGGYFQFPNWNSPEWAKAKASFGYTQGQDRPTESVDISSELFTEECKKNDVNFVGMISDTFPDHGRKNPSFIYANHIEMDSRVITLDITANQMDTDPDSPTFNKFGERCEIDPKLAVKDPFILKFAIKSKRNHDFGRKLTSYYDSFDDKRVINRHCVIWNEDIGPYGAWDTRGVTLVKADDAQATCYATKLGIYAIVAEIEDVPYAEDDETWLNIVKYIGYAISIILLLIFIGVILSSTYLWEMFHLIAVNMAFSLLFGHIFMLISELDAVRDDRDACSAIGLLILFFYSALSVFITMECYAMFKAIISGIIGGHTRTYLCFGYGVPLLHIGVSIFIHLQEMGTDPRCMVGWANEVKEAFYIPLAIFGILSVFLVLVMVCNINTPAMRKESMVEELGSLAKGLGVFVLLYALTWSWFPFAYMRFPTQEFPDFYPAFQVMNSFMGMFFFVFIGLMSNRFRTALTGGILMRRKALLADESADDNYVEQVNEDSITTMEDIEPEDEENEEDVEAAPRSRPESGKSVKEEQSENPDPDPEEEDVVNNDPVKNNNSPDPNPNEAEED